MLSAGIAKMALSRRLLHATSQATFAEMKRRPLPKTTSIKYTIPTDPYLLSKKFQQVASQGKLDDAVAIIMQSKTKSQSVIVWNLVIDTYAKTGRLSRALRAFTEMRRRGFKPTLTTYTALLKACALSDSENSMEIAQDAFDSMQQYGVSPSIITVNALLNVYLRKHNIEAILNRFNGLPAEGAMAPSLATYTIVLSALRRELQRRLDQLLAKPEDTVEVSSLGENRGYMRRRALKKEHVHATFGALMSTWQAFVEDAVRRIDSRPKDTSLLSIDAHIVNIVLKACHAAFTENRALGRQGLRVAELVYGLDRLDKQKSPADQKATDIKGLPVPLAIRISQSIAAGSDDDAAGSGPKDGLGPIIDDTTVELVLELCMRDDQPTKAVRFWRSVEANFEPMFRPSEKTRQKYQEVFSAHKQRSDPAKK